MFLKKVKFIKSSSKSSECPTDKRHEFAFIGRSNVGKSSLINSLIERKGLAKTSKTPGKTQLINHFLINSDTYFADLPGYGYAKTSKKNRAEFQKFTLNYLTNRINLIAVFLLIDLRLNPQKIDLEFMEFCGTNQIPFVICFTKADKLKKIEIENNNRNYQEELLKRWETFPLYFTTSSIEKTGLKEIKSFIKENNSQFKI